MADGPNALTEKPPSALENYPPKISFPSYLAYREVGRQETDEMLKAPTLNFTKELLERTLTRYLSPERVSKIWQDLQPHWINLWNVDEGKTLRHSKRVAWEATDIAKNNTLLPGLAEAQGLTRDEMIDIVSLAGLLHDIGKGEKDENGNFIDAPMLHSSGKVSETQARRHASAGYQILTKLGLPPIITEAVRDHLLPREGPSGSDSPLTDFVIAADILDAAGEKRSYKPSEPLAQAVPRLQEEVLPRISPGNEPLKAAFGAMANNLQTAISQAV